ncbi:hypothetical protein [Variovorax sp. tm]|uniref:hypothetical protein n=1 Tax=Variovorax atrisoli TaxID=3394203 RepID=UPI003A81395C
MANGNILQILLVEEETAKKINPATGLPNKWKVARCNILDETGEVVNVGRYRIPKSLEEVAVKGTYVPTFALGVPDWGDTKGDVGPIITSLAPYQRRSVVSPSVAAQAPKAQ